MPIRCTINGHYPVLMVPDHKLSSFNGHEFEDSTKWSLFFCCLVCKGHSKATLSNNGHDKKIKQKVIANESFNGISLMPDY